MLLVLAYLAVMTLRPLVGNSDKCLVRLWPFSVATEQSLLIKKRRTYD
jgi:hypothetical protein